MINRINSQIDHVLKWEPLKDLIIPYSPNHSNTTEEHVRTQVEMVRALAHKDYKTLTELIGFHSVQQIRTSSNEIADFFRGLNQDFATRDYKILSTLATVHDIGKQATAILTHYLNKGHGVEESAKRAVQVGTLEFLKKKG